MVVCAVSFEIHPGCISSESFYYQLNQAMLIPNGSEGRHPLFCVIMFGSGKEEMQNT